VTSEEYYREVVAHMVRQTDLTEQQARNLAGDPADMQDAIEDELLPSDFATEILVASAGA